jgi:glycosyltransferase involved in cell wall biosynthesis
VVIYNGKAGGPLNIAHKYGCGLFKRSWDGYGANKNKGINAAKYDWILSIDADEVPDEDLIKAIYRLNFDDATVVYDIKFRSFLGKKLIRFGNWGRDHHIRLFNRTRVKWGETMVHETLRLPEDVVIKKLDGHICHYSVQNIDEYNRKGVFYARLSAKKYFNTGKRANIFKLYISPIFGFIKNYIVYLGFLDGTEGWKIAITIVKNTWRKYHYLSEMENAPRKKETVEEAFLVEY